jgi:DNA-binding transcriptional regulator YdaS (Cro superfamily)
MNFKTWIGISGLQQKEVAKDLDLSPSYLSEIITGKKKATSEIAHSIEQYTKGEVRRNEIMLNQIIDNFGSGEAILDRGSPLTPELIKMVFRESGYERDLMT